MAFRGTLDRGWIELAASRGPFARSALYRLGLALQAAGVTDSDGQAQEIMYVAAQELPAHAPMRAVLKNVGMDVDTVAACLSAIEQQHAESQRTEDFEKARRLTAEENGTRRRWREVEALL